MTIDEAIEFVEDINRTVTFPENCKDEEFIDNVIDWLEELKAYKELEDKLICLTGCGFNSWIRFTTSIKD